MRQRILVPAHLAIFVLALGACSLGRRNAAQDVNVADFIVTSTAAVATQPANGDGPTPTGTPTPTTHPIFPTPILVETWVAEQEFEHGWAFYLQDRREIWVASFADERGGTWSIYEDEFGVTFEQTGQELAVEFDEEPPDEKVMPVRGFGWLWANTPDVRDELGWGVWIELGQQSTLRYDAGGAINADGDYLPRRGRFTLVNINGDAFIFDEETETFTWEPIPE